MSIMFPLPLTPLASSHPSSSNRISSDVRNEMLGNYPSLAPPSPTPGVMNRYSTFTPSSPRLLSSSRRPHTSCGTKNALLKQL